MRHIKKPDLRGRIKEKWHKAAKAALAEVKRQPADQRGAFITSFFKKNKDLWARLKKNLAQPTPAKCWYSEARRPVAELEIDHFRPKGAVTGCKHAGYWWLAFNWENFRMATPLANKRRHDEIGENTQGKGTHFPLWDESKRVPDDEECSTKNETPLLLDPFVAKDVVLLDYSPEDGKVVERYDKAGNELRYVRANKSIELYHLNEGSLVARRGELAAILSEKGDKLEALWMRKEAGETLAKPEDDEIESLQNEIGELINATSEFSAFCRASLRQRGNRGWNEELLTIA